MIRKIVNYAMEQRLGILGLSFSPIKGPEGNIEYLIYLAKNQRGMAETMVQEMLDKTVDDSHYVLSERRAEQHAEGGADCEY